MRSTLLVLATISLMGCGSTRIIEAPLDESALSEIEARCITGCFAEVAFSDWKIPVDLSRDADSAYQRLRQVNATIRLQDSQVLRGPVRRFVSDPQSWLAFPVVGRDDRTAPVRFNISSIDSAWVAGSSGKTKTYRFRAEGDRLHLGSERVIPIAAIERVKLSDTQGSLPLTIGSTALLGAASGLAGLAIGHGISDCSGDFCFGPELLGFTAGLVTGMAVGAHFGNGRRGSFGLDVLGGMVGLGAGAAVVAIDPDSVPVAIGGAITALAVPVAFERFSTRRRYRASAIVAPVPSGAAFSLNIGF